MKRFIIIALLLLSGCSAGNLDYVKERSETKWKELGYTPIAYEGFQWGFGGFGTEYWGAKVWWTMERKANGIVYTGYIQRWGNELHIYGPKAIDAIKP